MLGLVLNAIKYKTWFVLLSHSQLMTTFPPSIQRLYKPLFQCWWCSPEIVNVLLPSFWDPRMPYWRIPVFILGKHIFTSTIQSQHFFIFFAFYQDLDDIDWLQDTTNLVALNAFLSGMNWPYVILIEQTTIVPSLADWRHPGGNLSCGELETNYKTQEKVSPN